MIKWIKSILIAIILFASIITIFDFADGILRNKEEKPVNQPATLAEKSPQKKEVIIDCVKHFLSAYFFRS